MSQLEAKPQKQSQVTEQTNILEKNLGVLHARIEALTSALSSVLRPSIPNEKVTEGERAELVVLASTLEGFSDSVKSVNYRLEDILDRLEI